MKTHETFETLSQKRRQYLGEHGRRRSSCDFSTGSHLSREWKWVEWFHPSTATLATTLIPLESSLNRFLHCLNPMAVSLGLGIPWRRGFSRKEMARLVYLCSLDLVGDKSSYFQVLRICQDFQGPYLHHLLRPCVPDDPCSCQMDGSAVFNQYRFLIQSVYLQKTSGQGVRTHPPMVLSAMVGER